MIEFSSLAYTSHASASEILRGRRWGHLLEELKKFFDALIEEGIELVFFSEGYKTPQDDLKWLSYKTKIYFGDCEIMEDIQKGKDLSKIKSYKSAITIYRDYLEQNLKPYGKWIQVCDSEINVELARYAKENQVFAVFSDDIEFLIYEGRYRLYRIRNIRFDTISTKEINKFNIRKALGLFPEHMPLFATLCGNDIITEEKLETFHSSFPEKVRIKGIAKYVTKVKARDEPVDVEKVSNRIGCCKEDVEKSLQKYELVSVRILVKSNNFEIYFLG